MDCLTLFKTIGIECAKVNDTYVLSSPTSFSDGSPMNIYIKEEGDALRFSDDGDTMFSLNANGLHMTDGRKFNYLSDHAGDFNIMISDNGAFTSFAPIASAGKVASNFLAFYAFVADWERKALAIGNEESSFIDKVITDLRARFPNASIVERPEEIYGASGAGYKFDVKMDERYVDIISAHSNSTGAMLRKAADINKSGDGNQMLVIIDDSKNPDKAEIESLILNDYCPTMMASSLLYNNSTTH